MKNLLRSLSTALAVAALAVPAQAQTFSVPDDQYLGAASIGRDGTVLLVKTHKEGIRSVMSIGDREWVIPDLRINAAHLVPGDPLRVRVGGTTGTHRVTRLYRLGEHAQILWDSEHLQGVEDPSLSRDGRHWMGTRSEGDRDVFIVGTTDGYVPTLETSFAPMDRGTPPVGLDLGTQTFMLEGVEPRMIAFWNGHVFVLNTFQELLPGPHDSVTGIFIHGQTVWATGDFGRLIGWNLAKNDPTSPRMPDYRVDPERLGIGPIGQIARHPDGRMLIQVQKDGGYRLLALDVSGDRPQVEELATLPAHSRLTGYGALTRSETAKDGVQYRVVPLN